MELLQEYWIHYTFSNAIALVVLAMAWVKPHVSRIALGVIFLLASAVNSWTAITTPTEYLIYREFSLLEVYRSFIDGWFSQHITEFVLAIAVGQLLIGIGIMLRSRYRQVAIVGVVIFSVAIAPLGVGAALPCTLLLAIAAVVQWSDTELHQKAK